jgi:hypothetical protein
VFFTCPSSWRGYESSIDDLSSRQGWINSYEITMFFWGFRSIQVLRYHPRFWEGIKFWLIAINWFVHVPKKWYTPNLLLFLIGILRIHLYSPMDFIFRGTQFSVELFLLMFLVKMPWLRYGDVCFGWSWVTVMLTHIQWFVEMRRQNLR